MGPKISIGLVFIDGWGNAMLGRLLILFALVAPEVVFASIKLHEEVVLVPKKLLIGSVALETTIFKSDGDGPFPLAIINYGKSSGNSHMQERYRPIASTRCEGRASAKCKVYAVDDFVVW